VHPKSNSKAREMVRAKTGIETKIKSSEGVLFLPWREQSDN
jgi:hypothetical protein